MTDWLAFLILMGLYLGMATQVVVRSSRRFYDNKTHGVLLAMVLVVPYVLVAVGDGRSNPTTFLNGLGRMALYLAVPAVALVLRPKGAKALHPLGIVAVLAIWLPIEFDWLPQVAAHLGAGVDIPVALLTGVVLALVCFLVIRPLPMGYTFRLTDRDFRLASKALAAYMITALPLGLVTRFLVIEVAPFDTFQWIWAWPLGYLFTALPEEMLFRGVIQQLIQDRVKNERLALALASVIFGLAHLNNGTPGYAVPNWMYAVMAMLAGVAYGWTWRRTGKVTGSAVVHATVNYIWGILLGG
ncbi:MAG: CPBP family intramembrane metalloprotease [Ardenticatenaceae bacterium]|nr:CPBP family intramembrane metalloprotease [Ardenticatenaceae bacterium]